MSSLIESLSSRILNSARLPFWMSLTFLLISRTMFVLQMSASCTEFTVLGSTGRCKARSWSETGFFLPSSLWIELLAFSTLREICLIGCCSQDLKQCSIAETIPARADLSFSDARSPPTWLERLLWRREANKGQISPASLIALLR